jgi:hypothetical protein
MKQNTLEFRDNRYVCFDRRPLRFFSWVETSIPSRRICPPSRTTSPRLAV